MSQQLGARGQYMSLKQQAILWIGSLILALACVTARAEILNISNLAEFNSVPLGKFAEVLVEEQDPITLDTARERYRDGRFAPSTRPVLNFGLGVRPVWVRVALLNPSDSPKTIYATLGTTWIDHLDAYLVSDQGSVTSLHVGDALPGALGVWPGIGTGGVLTVPSGNSELYVRAETPDPMLLPLALATVRNQATNERIVQYAYGTLYGFLLALIFYNCMLFFGLHRRSQLYYALYLSCFIAMNACYTGHGFAFVWPERPDIQRFVIVAAIVMYAASGLWFARSFLELAKHAPLLNRWVRGFALAGVVAMALCIALDNQQAAVLLAFTYLSSVTAIMVALGAYAVVVRRNAGIYFFAATLSGMLGAAATTTSVWGLIPLNTFTYHGIEFGIVLEATLLALAITQQMGYEQTARLKAEYLAQRDPLTGLYNRRAFLDLSRVAWEQSHRNARPLSVLMLDIDHFKKINDQYGHDGGDKLLLSVSQLLTATCRKNDLLARWGGEEFVLLLPETDIEHARLLAERIRHLIEETGHTASQSTILSTLSIGVAEYATDADLGILIARADARLYEAKKGGRNRVCG